jgi:hypothetical protein
MGETFVIIYGRRKSDNWGCRLSQKAVGILNQSIKDQVDPSIDARGGRKEVT